jgi:signal peptidase II
MIEEAALRWILYIVSATLGILLDLGSKEWAFEYHPDLKAAGHRIDVIPTWFDIQLSVNQGAAWGMFWGRHTFFLVVSVVAFLALTYFVQTAPPKARRGPVILGLVFAGVFGNFWDRVNFGYVRDFLHCHTPDAGAAHDLVMKIFGHTEWPTFNVADMFICVGAGSLVLLFWRDEKKAATDRAAPAAVAPAPAPAPAPAEPAP